MRRVALTLVWTALVVLAVPSPAAAWWEFLEELSGPGWWKGFDIDARLFCLVDPLSQGTEKELVELMTRVAAKEQPPLRIREFTQQDEARRRLLSEVGAEVTDWKTRLDEWERVFDAWHLAAGRSVDRIAAVRMALAYIRTRADMSLDAVVPATQTWLSSKNDDEARNSLKTVVDKAERDAATALEALRRAADTMHDIADSPRMAVAAFPGVIYSACKLNSGERRRAAFDVGMRFLWTNDDRFASGERISFTTIEPAFAWRVFEKPEYDVLEYGIGAGFYWISSKAFPSVTGGFVEPARFDFHVPTSFATKNTLPRKIVRSIIFRVGYLAFPGGFEPDAFLADPLNPETHRRIGRDWVRYYGFYVDTEVFR
jgi:hypothetical protein